MPDAFLRLLIKVKMAAHLSGGDIDTVLYAVASLYGIEPEQLTLTELFPAKIQVMTAPNVLTDEQMAMAQFYHKFIKRIIAAGVGFILGMQTETPIPDIRLRIKPLLHNCDFSSTTLQWVDWNHQFDQHIAVAPVVSQNSFFSITGLHLYDAPCEQLRDCGWLDCPDHPFYILSPLRHPFARAIKALTFSSLFSCHHICAHLKQKKIQALRRLPADSVVHENVDFANHHHLFITPSGYALINLIIAGQLEMNVSRVVAISVKQQDVILAVESVVSPILRVMCSQRDISAEDVLAVVEHQSGEPASEIDAGEIEIYAHDANGNEQLLFHFVIIHTYYEAEEEA